MINFVDYISAGIVILCVLLKFRNRFLWALYSLACFAYIFLNYSKGLHGQAILNVVVVIIALYHVFHKKKKKTVK